MKRGRKLGSGLNMLTINFKLESATLDKLNKFSRMQGCSRAEYIRQILRSSVQKKLEV